MQIFRYLINLVVHENLKIHLMDTITTYLHGSLDNDIYMKIPKELKKSESYSIKSQEMFSIRLQKSLYGKQSRCVWYNRLNKYAIKKRYINNITCHCISIKKMTSKFVMLVIYVDDINLIEFLKRFKRQLNI